MTTQTNDKTVNAITGVLGKTFALYVKTHGFHWNVEGPQFRQLHEFFEEQYTNLWGSLDDIAERIRARDAYAPGALKDFLGFADTEASGETPPSGPHMLAELTADHQKLAETLREAIAIAQEAGDEPSAGLLTDRLDWHEQQIWMMKAMQK